MGLRDKLLTQNSPLSNLNGGAATVPIFKNSKLHFEYSINDTPNIPGKPSPSDLDLGGINPKSANKDATTPSINDSFKNGTYRDNLPFGGSF